MGKVKRSRERSILKGALAGLVGGIVGAGAKVVAERLYPAPVTENASLPIEAEPQLEMAAKPWVLGGVAGAAYGAAIEIEPKSGVWQGAGFGLALRKLRDEVTSLQAGAAELTVRQRTQQGLSEWVSFAVFGVVTEAVRRLIRRGL